MQCAAGELFLEKVHDRTLPLERILTLESGTDDGHREIAVGAVCLHLGVGKGGLNAFYDFLSVHLDPLDSIV